jgi:hypothetical protein
MSGTSWPGNRSIENEPPAPAWPPASNGTTWMVTLRRPLATSRRWASCLRITARPPTGRRIAPSSRIVHTIGGPGWLSRCCRDSRRSTRRWISRAGAAEWPSSVTARAYSSVWNSPCTNCISNVRMMAAAVSRPRYSSNQSAVTSAKDVHQPGSFACRCSAFILARKCGSVTEYRASRSSTSRSLNPTRPFSSRLIFERDPRIAWAASSQETPAWVRSRCNWSPSISRWRVGPRPPVSESPLLIFFPPAIMDRRVPLPPLHDSAARRWEAHRFWPRQARPLLPPW